MLSFGIKYNEKYRYAQDYRMWISCSDYAECAIIPESLLNYRVHSKAISSSKKEMQSDCVYKIIQEQLDKLNLTLYEEIKPLHEQLLTARKPFDLRIKNWMQEIIDANRIYHIYDQKKLKDLLYKKWAEICYFGFATQKGLKAKISVLVSLPISQYIELFRIRKARSKAKE